jgi:hypothetical protein
MYEINCTIVYSQINEAFFFIYGKKIQWDQDCTIQILHLLKYIWAMKTVKK